MSFREKKRYHSCSKAIGKGELMHEYSSRHSHIDGNSKNEIRKDEDGKKRGVGVETTK